MARLSLLGTTALWTPDGERVALTAAERRLLAALGLAGHAGVPESRLAQVVWEGAEPPPAARQSLQNHISRLRHKVGAELIRREDRGYSLGSEVSVDLVAFDQAVRSARDAQARRDWAALHEHAERGCEAIQGDPLADLPRDQLAASRRARILEQRTELEELRAEALLELGQPHEAVAELRRLTEIAPGRERRWELLMLALERIGWRTEALATFHAARRTLIAAHGVEPASKLQDLHQRLLTRGIRPSAESETAPVGRQEDVAAITAMLDAGHSVLLTGPAGIGKSTLLRMLTAAWSGPSVFVDCSQNPWLALGPVEELMERLAETLRVLDLPTDLAQLKGASTADAPGRVRRPGGLRARAIEALGQALSSMRGVCVLIDDIDRAGPTTRDILVGAVAAAGVACVTTARASDPSQLLPLVVTAHALGGLDVPALTELAAYLRGTDARSDRVGRWLHTHTGGHPMYARELLASAARYRPWENDAAPTLEELDLGGTLITLLQGRLDGLPPSCRALLDTAAVMEDPLDLELLRRVADVAGLEELIEAAVLTRTSTGQVRFAHSLFRIAAHEAIPAGRRAELHHTVGLLSSSPAVRAHHLTRSVEVDPDAAAAAATDAGEAAFAEQAYADASHWFGEAARIAADHGYPDEQVLDLRLEACESARLSGLPGHADPLLDVAEAALIGEHVDLRRRAILAAVQLGEAVDPGPRQQRAVRLAERAIAAENDPTWRARLNATASILHSMAGTSLNCRQMFMTGLAALEPDDDEAMCDVLPYAYMALGHPADLELREQATQTLLDAARRLGDRTAEWEANHLAFSVAIMRADGEALRRAVDEAERLLTFSGDAGRRWSLQYMRAALAAIEGRMQDAEQLSQQALETGSGVAPSRAMSVLSAQLLAIQWQQGRLDEFAGAITYLIEAQPEIAAWKAAGSMILAVEDPDRAGALFDELAAGGFDALPKDFTWLVGVLCLGHAAVRLQDAGRAAKILPHLEPYAGLVCWQGSCSYGPVAAVTGDLAALLGDSERAGAWHQDAQRLRAQLSGTSSAGGNLG